MNTTTSSSTTKLVYIRTVSMILMTWGIFAVVVLLQQSFHLIHLSARLDPIQPCNMMASVGMFLSHANGNANRSSYSFSSSSLVRRNITSAATPNPPGPNTTASSSNAHHPTAVAVAAASPASRLKEVRPLETSKLRAEADKAKAEAKMARLRLEAEKLRLEVSKAKLDADKARAEAEKATAGIQAAKDKAAFQAKIAAKQAARAEREKFKAEEKTREEKAALQAKIAAKQAGRSQAGTKKTPNASSDLPRPPRYAVAQFIDNPNHLYGIYSIKTQMEYFHMTQQQQQGGVGVGLVAVVPKEFPSRHPKAWKALNELLLPANNSNDTDTTTAVHQEDNNNNNDNDKLNNNNRIYQVDTQYIHQRLDKSMWKGTFNKLWMFNLTHYDKLIVLDCDILIRQSLMHWFDYSTPAATQPVGAITWNSGAMVIQPNSTIFQQMMEVLPKVKAPPKKKTDDEDTWNTWISDQGFLSTFFSSKLYGGNDPTKRMKTLPIEASVLSKSLIQPNFKYWVKFRRHIIQTVHFTKHKPWKDKTAPKYEILCDMLKEWVQSMEGVERYYPGIPPLQGDCLRNCKK